MYKVLVTLSDHVFNPTKTITETFKTETWGEVMDCLSELQAEHKDLIWYNVKHVK